MTVGKDAQTHIAKAREYLARGDKTQDEANEFYRHAASEMELAKDAGATTVEIADALGKSTTWVKDIIRWGKIPANDGRRDDSPFGGEEKQELRERSILTRRLSDPDKTQEIVDALPREAVYEIEKAVAARLGSPITGDNPVDSTPRSVVQAFDHLKPEQRARVVQDIVQHREFAEAVNENPRVRDEMMLTVFGTPAAQKERSEEKHREDIGRNAIHGWRPVVDALGDANRALTHVLDGLVKLAINRGVNPEEDPLGVAKGRAEMIGRSIHEIEMAWGETPITDKIEELRGERV